MWWKKIRNEPDACTSGKLKEPAGSEQRYLRAV